MKTEKIVGACAIFISVLALMVSIWQGMVAREHNRLSVTPKLISTPQLEGKGGKNGIYLSNVGLGPAFIQKAYLRVNGKQYNLGANPWPHALEEVGLKSLCFATSWLPSGAALKSQEEVALIAVTRADLGACYLEAMKLISSNEISINIIYESMYGVSGEVNSDVSLGRNDFNFSKLVMPDTN